MVGAAEKSAPWPVRARLAYSPKSVSLAPSPAAFRIAVSASFGRIGPAFDHRLQRVGAELAVLRRGRQPGRIDRAHPRQLRLAVVGGVVVVEVAVDGVLVLIALLEVGDDPVLVEEVLEEDVFLRQPHRLERGRGLHPHVAAGRAKLIGRGGDTLRVDALAVGQDRLA
jgi:hypothetical protein